MSKNSKKAWSTIGKLRGDLKRVPSAKSLCQPGQPWRRPMLKHCWSQGKIHQFPPKNANVAPAPKQCTIPLLEQECTTRRPEDTEGYTKIWKLESIKKMQMWHYPPNNAPFTKSVHSWSKNAQQKTQKLRTRIDSKKVHLLKFSHGAGMHNRRPRCLRRDCKEMCSAMAKLPNCLGITNLMLYSEQWTFGTTQPTFTLHLEYWPFQNS